MSPSCSSAFKTRLNVPDVAGKSSRIWLYLALFPFFRIIFSVENNELLIEVIKADSRGDI